jgi:group I intron endonuclease
MDSGKQYIGSTVNFHRRYVFHLYYLARNKHHSPTMQNSYNKYGEMSFEHTILELVQPENLKAREQAWIDLLRPVFNVAQHVERSVLGIKFGPAPAERGARISAAKKGKLFTDEHKANLSAAQRGKPRKPLSDAHKASISAAKKAAFAAKGY